jgi:hypothetical protein
VNVALYADQTISLPVRELCDRLSEACDQTTFVLGEARFQLLGRDIEYPLAYGALSAQLQAETAGFDLSLLTTTIPYANNFFFQADGPRIILSLAGWEDLTSLPVENGVAYFAAALMIRETGIGVTHDENTGCVNDFWWDKSGIDIGMRGAYLCGDCLRSVAGDGRRRGSLADVRAILNLVARASSRDSSILEVAAPAPVEATGAYHTFLCHNSADKPAVRDVNERLLRAGLRTWLDEDELPPGLPWQDELERAISDVRSALVFVGASGFGPWQSPEMRAFLDEFVRRRCPVIPALLPGSADAPDLPILLRQMTWVDLREPDPKRFARLVAYLHSLA